MSKRKSLARLAVGKSQSSQDVPEESIHKSSSNARPLSYHASIGVSAGVQNQAAPPHGTSNEVPVPPATVTRRLPGRSSEENPNHPNSAVAHSNRHSYPAAAGALGHSQALQLDGQFQIFPLSSLPAVRLRSPPGPPCSSRLAAARGGRPRTGCRRGGGPAVSCCPMGGCAGPARRPARRSSPSARRPPRTACRAPHRPSAAAPRPAAAAAAAPCTTRTPLTTCRTGRTAGRRTPASGRPGTALLTTEHRTRYQPGLGTTSVRMYPSQ